MQFDSISTMLVKPLINPFLEKLCNKPTWGDEAFINQAQKHINQKQSDSIHVTKRSK
ncbi:MAG: hypothetical protein V3V31_08205 [Methylococcales bacterium]